jgi:hypothetical protein
MAGTNRNLTLMLLPQRWDGTGTLIVNLLLLPNGDPTAPVTSGTGEELPFSQAQPVLRASFLSGLSTPPWSTITPAPTPTPISLTLPYSSAAPSIWSGLATQYTPQVIPLTSQTSGIIRKDLPDSYLQVTGFQQPDTDFFTTDDGFGCALGSASPTNTQVTTREIQWGEVLSYALRQPLIAQAMGLMYLNIPISIDPSLVSGGGWIWLEIDTTPSSNWYASLVTANPSVVVSYAARLPALAAAQDVFAAVLFPTVSANYASQALDDAQNEADLYLDGFAKIVHANQPTTVNAVTTGVNNVVIGGTPQSLNGTNAAKPIVPGTDAGIQIGWDDVQVTNWVNRQVQIAQALSSSPPPTTPVAELPLSVLGYRVDAREDPTDNWSSLCAGNGTLNAAGVFTTNFTGTDLCLEPTPIQNGGTSQDFWLPRYFAQWRGRTLVVNDQYGYVLSGGQPPTTSTPADSEFSGTLSESLPPFTLRYGNPYQFRTRLADLTGGGPQSTDSSPADAGITTVNFRRFIPPKKVPVTLGALSVDGTQPLLVDRPPIHYPEMVFSGAADQATLDALVALTPPQPPVRQFPPPDGSNMPTVPSFQAYVLDPDVTTLEVIVEAQAPQHDTGEIASMASADTPPARGDLDGIFRVVYVWHVDFPPLASPQMPGASTPIQLTLQPTPMPHIDAPVVPSSANPTGLPIPTGRNVRLRLRALGAPDPGNLYFGNAAARTGLVADLRVRFEAQTENDLIANQSLDLELQAFYLRDLDQSATQDIVTSSVINVITQSSSSTFNRQSLVNLVNTLTPPATTPIQLLASALQLPVDGLTIAAPPGRRILFGAESKLRHTLPQDRSSITFSNHKDLIGHWIVVTHVTVDRDWTWSGLAQNGSGQLAFTFMGTTYDDGSSPGPLGVLGQIDMPGVVSSLATQAGTEPVNVNRDSTELIFFSTIDSTTDMDLFPLPTHGSYQLIATLTGAPTTPVTLWSGSIEVPVTAPPRQVPRLVSAGIAESPYTAAPDYSSTTQRDRALWLEFDRKPDDDHDAYFIRLINYGPDPLLISYPFDLPSAADTPMALDPEPIRQITPDSGNDDAGLAAMTQLQPSGSSSVHFLMPLPDGISPSALDLFGFWTYEIRCGHLLWSTAQGRFGRPLRVSGVQHHCPALTALTHRANAIPSDGGAIQPCIVASAGLAQTVLNGQSLTNPAAPQTQLWFLLYAQLRRADGKAWRNLLLGRLLGQPLTTTGLAPGTNLPGNTLIGPQQQSIPVQAAFSQSEVENQLADLLLPANTPLSVLAVELFNAEAQVINEQFAEIDPSTNLQNLLNARAGHGFSTPFDASMAVAQRSATNTTTTNAIVAVDPLGADIGNQRILRVSPLTPVAAIC